MPTVIVLYGATGDLAKRMVLPAFFELYVRGLLPPQWRLIGNGRGDVAHEDFRAHVHDVARRVRPRTDRRAVEGFAEHVLFAGGGFRADDGGQPART